MNIGKEIKLLRKKLKMTQLVFCKRVKLTQSTLSKIENGKSDITFKTLMNITKLAKKNKLGFYHGDLWK